MHPARRLARVVRVRLERHTEERDRRAAQLAEVLLQLRDHPPRLQLVHLDHRVDEVEVVAAVSREELEERDVLREARAAVADARAQEVRPEPVVEPDGLRDRLDVRADELADVGNLVDEADARREERVRRELHHLRRGDVHVHDRRVERRMQLFDASAVLRIERADHDPVGMQEVVQRGALREELRVRHVADVCKAARVERRAHFLAGADGNGALHDERRVAADMCQLVDHRPHGGEICVAAVCRRRADGDVEELCAVDRVAHARRKRKPFCVACHDLVQTRLEDRHDTRAELLDSLRHDVAHDDVVPELGEAHPCNEPYVTSPEDADSRHGLRLVTNRPKSTCNRDHRLVRELVAQRVHDPIAGLRRPQDDHVEMRAVVVVVVAATAEDLAQRRMLQDRRVVPVRLLDAPVDVAWPCDKGQAESDVLPRRLVEADRSQEGEA